MRLVEAVPGEELHQVENLGGLLLADPVAARPFHEGLALLGHDLRVLLPHGFAQHVGLPHGEAGKHRRDPHDLLLVGDDAVRVGEDGRQLRELVLDLRLSLLPGDEVVDHPALQGSRPVEGVERDQVVEAFRLCLAEQFAHPGALELEHPVRLPLAKQLVGLRIVQRDGVDVEVDAFGPLDLVEGVADQGERAQAKEVHLQQADALDLLHGPLRDDFVLLTLVKRNEFGERPRRNHDAGRVNRGVPRHSLEALGHIEQLAHAVVLVPQVPERRALLERFGQGHVERGRHGLGDAVGVGIGDVHHPRHVPDHRPRLHRAERDDLRDVLPAVLAGDVVDDLPPPALAEIDVDVRQRHAFGVQEPLEDEVVLHRIDVGDPEAVGNEAAGRRSAPWPDRDPLLARIPDEIPHDQEVPGVLHLLDHVDLVGQPPFVLVDRVLQDPAGGQLLQPGQSLRKAFPHDVLEIVVEREACRHVEVREVIDRAGEVDIASFGNAHAVGERLRKVLEDHRHLGRCLQIELIPVVFEPLLVVDGLSGADAEQDVVRLEIGILEVVHVVGDHQVESEIRSNRLQAHVDHLLLVDPLILHLEKEIAPPEDVAVRGRRLQRLVPLLGADAGRHLPFEAAAQPDQAARVPGEQVLVDPRLVVEALGVAGRDQLDQVVVPLLRFRQQHEMVGGLSRGTALRPAIARGDIHLAPEDRVDAALACRVVEDNRREHVAVLGNRHRRHVQLHCPVEQFLDPARAVEQRVLRMKVKMDEVGACAHSHSIVDGGLELMSYTTRLIPFTSFTIRDDIAASRSCGSLAQSAVIPSLLSTARSAIVYSYVRASPMTPTL